MDLSSIEELLGPELSGALRARGFSSLTPVQAAVMSAELGERDLRISSQTGSGKTVAIGLALREVAKEPDVDGKPRILLIVPTRELAKQVEEELAWLYAPFKARVVSVMGGTSVMAERRALASKPRVVVGTPGRLLDHLRRGALVVDGVQAVALDEADRMLDMGFREELEEVLGALPENRRTLLVSATFPREVKSLADKIQNDPLTVQGTPLGHANADIDHVIHLVHANERLSAMVNLLLLQPGSQTLIFARTRADVADISAALSEAGFRIAAISGELEQRARNRALEAFKRGELDALVATDVAARGIDVNDVVRVVQTEPPSDADTYTHRSGRTGRAGKKGTAAMLVTPGQWRRALTILQRARVPYRIEPLPTAQSLQKAEQQRLLDWLSNEEFEGVPHESTWALAKQIAKEGDVTRALGRLIHRVRQLSQATPRDITPVHAPDQRGVRAGYGGRDAGYGAGPTHAPRGAAERSPRARSEGARGGEEWVAFRVSWGQMHGADPRRLVAMACRRGNIQGSDIGPIRVGERSSSLSVAASVAADFERSAAAPDPRDPRISFLRDDGPPARSPRRRDEAPQAEVPAARVSRPRKEAAAEVPPARVSRPRSKEVVAEVPAARVSRPRKEAAAEVPPARPSRPRKPTLEMPAARPSRPRKDETASRREPSSRPAPPADRSGKPFKTGKKKTGGTAAPTRSKGSSAVETRVKRRPR